MLHLTTVTTIISMVLFERLVLIIDFYTIEVCGFYKYLPKYYVPYPLHYLWLCADFTKIRSLDDQTIPFLIICSLICSCQKLFIELFTIFFFFDCNSYLTLPIIVIKFLGTIQYTRM